MKDDEFIRAVRVSAGIDDADRGKDAVRATLSVLGQRVTAAQIRDLAAQLPGEVAGYLPLDGAGGSFSVEEFYGRVARAEHLGCHTQARKHAQAVAAAIKATVEPDEFADLVAHLPADYADLLGTPPIRG